MKSSRLLCEKLGEGADRASGWMQPTFDIC
jgi:hypothetical protein